MKLFQKKKKEDPIRRIEKKNCSIAGKIDGGFIVALIFFSNSLLSDFRFVLFSLANILFGGGSQLSEHRGEEEPITY